MQKATKSLYSSPAAKQEIQALYHGKLNELGIEYRFSTVPTSFGETNVIVTGTAGKPSMLLFHGSNGCAPIAIEALIELLDHYHVYAVDVIAQPNLSAETRPSMKDHAYGIWVNEIIDTLNLSDVTLVGTSFGGLVSWRTMVYDESKVKKAFLIVPAGIANGSPFKLFINVFKPMKRFKKTKEMDDLDKFLDALFTDRDPFARKFLPKVFEHFTMDFTPVPTIKKADAAGIKTPIYLVVAKDDLVFPGEKVMKRAKKIFPSLEEVLLLEDSKHVQNEVGNKRVVDWILSK